MDSTTPLLSIVVPVYNRARLVTRTLDSIAAQTHTNFHLIIVDNNSTDSTPDTLQMWVENNAGKFNNVSVVSQPRPGASAARNCGLQHVATPYVMFFDSDDIMLPDHIRSINELLEKRPDTDVVHWDEGIMDADGWLSVKSPRFHDPLQLHILHSSLSTQRFAIRTDLIRNCGGWDESLPAWNDLELGVRVLTHIPKPIVRKVNGEPTVIVFPQTESITGTSYHSQANAHKLALEKISIRVASIGNPQYDLTVKAKTAILAGLYKKEGAHKEAESMLKMAIDNVSFNPRQVLKFIYQIVRFFSGGGAAIALAFFGTKRQKC